VTGLWQSINFVTARDVRRVAASHGATVTFERGLLADPIDRLREPEFVARHRTLGRLARVLDLLTPALRKASTRAVDADDRVVAHRRHDRVGMNSGQPGSSELLQLLSDTHGATVSTITCWRNRPGMPTSKRRSSKSARCAASAVRSG
jgi:hypothetical protein